MAGNFQPLDQKFAIVDGRGQPTDYFIRWAQQKQIDIGEAITLVQLQEYLDEHALQEGSGIQFNPDGSINNSPIISADAQEILDQIATTRGTVIYRGLLGWAALAPGAAGQFLKTNGAGADPAWAATGGGGSSGNLYAFPQGGAIGANDTGAFATLSNGFILAKAVTVDKLYGLFNSVGAGGTYKMFIATVDNAGNITGTLVTSSTTYTTTGAGAVFVEFDLAAPATLAANTNYICALVITSGIGTTANRAYQNSGNTYPTLPLAWDLMLSRFGGINTKRFWYAQNSSAPVAGAPSSSATATQYHLGMRIQA